MAPKMVEQTLKLVKFKKYELTISRKLEKEEFEVTQDLIEENDKFYERSFVSTDVPELGWHVGPVRLWSLVN